MECDSGREWKGSEGKGREGKGKAAQAAPTEPSLVRPASRFAAQRSIPSNRVKPKSAMILASGEAPAPKPFHPGISFCDPLNCGHVKHRNGASQGGPAGRRFLGAKANV